MSQIWINQSFSDEYRWNFCMFCFSSQFNFQKQYKKFEFMTVRENFAETNFDIKSSDSKQIDKSSIYWSPKGSITFIKIFSQEYLFFIQKLYRSYTPQMIKVISFKIEIHEIWKQKNRLFSIWKIITIIFLAGPNLS